MSEFFTVNQLAEYFGVNPKTIYRRLWAKQIPAYKVGRTWRIAKKDIFWFRGVKSKYGDIALLNPRSYHTWMAMIQRCENPKNRAYRYYGGRGISVCKRWQDFEKFSCRYGRKTRRSHNRTNRQ